MRRDQRLERRHEPVEAREAAPEVRPVGLLEQLLEPLVAAVDRVEERDRVGRVDEHGEIQLAGRREDRREPLVVGQHQRAALVDDAEAEVLPDLEPARARRRASAAGSPTRTPASKPGRPIARRSTWQNVRKRPGMRAVVAVEVALQLVAPEAVEVDDRLDAGLVERRDQLADVGDRPRPLGAAHEVGRVERQPVVPQPEPAPEVVVRVDGGDERQRDVRLRKHEPRLRQPVAERRCSHLDAGRAVPGRSPARAAGRSCGRRRRRSGSADGSGSRAGMSTGFGVSPCRICGPRAGRAGRAAARPRSAPSCTGAAGCRRPCAPGPPRRCARGT